MLESIGFLSIIFILLLLFTKHLESKEVKKREDEEKIKNSYACQDLIIKHNESIRDGKPTLTNSKLNKKLQKTINDPKEKELIKERIHQNNIYNKQRLDEDKRFQEKRLRIAYKYFEEIFEIFNDNRELSKTELLESINIKFKCINMEETEKIFKIWNENWLITNCNWNKLNWEISDVLNPRFREFAFGDVSYNQWLKDNNIILKPVSKEFKKYIK